MSKLPVICGSLLLTSIAMASEGAKFYEENHQALHMHHFSPIAFYKIHREGKYNHESTGVGIKYDNIKEKGLNFGTTICSNLETNTPFIETEAYLGVRFKTDFLYFTPKIINKHITHQISKTDSSKLIVQKGTSYFGLALQPNYDSIWKVSLEGYLFRDLYNNLITEKQGEFYGVRFVNPFGYRANLNIGVNPIDIFFMEFNGSYSKAFEGEYWEASAQFAISWRY